MIKSRLSLAALLIASSAWAAPELPQQAQQKDEAMLQYIQNYMAKSSYNPFAINEGASVNG